MLCECGILHRWKPNKDGVLQLMKNKENAKRGNDWWSSLKGKRYERLLSCYVLFVLLACKWILATKYLQGYEGFHMVVNEVEISKLVGDNKGNLSLLYVNQIGWLVKWLKGQECWGPRRKACL